MAAGGHFVKNWLSHVLSPNFENFVSVLHKPVQNGKLQVPFDYGRDPIKNGRSASVWSLVFAIFRHMKCKTHKRLEISIYPKISCSGTFWQGIHWWYQIFCICKNGQDMPIFRTYTTLKFKKPLFLRNFEPISQSYHKNYSVTSFICIVS